MKILILSCGTGEGHNSAAKAIYEEFRLRSEKVYLKDALSFGNKTVKKMVETFFNGVAVKTPSVFGAMYKAGSIISNKVIKSPVYLANLTYAEKLHKYIIDNEIASSLTFESDNNTMCIVLTGKNQKLKKDIEKKFNKRKVLAIEFTKKVELYMDACDILLSKPGGLSSTEAAVKEVPLIHTMPIPGCETKNSDFFSKRKMSIKATTLKNVIDSSLKLLNNEMLKSKMIRNQIKHINKYAANDIASEVIKHK